MGPSCPRADGISIKMVHRRASRKSMSDVRR
jgi:hypothetical protein